MSALWWQMPGPSRFIAKVAEDLRDGKNVVLQLPEHCPIGLYGSLKHKLSPDGGWSIRQIALGDTANSLPPLAMLVTRCALGDTSEESWTVVDLAQSDVFLNQVIWIDGIEWKNWHDWCEFLREYAHVCRNVSMYERSLFVIPLVGKLGETGVDEDVCLSVHRWQGYVDGSDMLLYAARLMDPDTPHVLIRRLTMFVLAQLALWDPALAEYLSRQDLSTLLEPQNALLDFASIRGWKLGDRPAWHEGKTDSFEGSDRIHSAYLALSDPDGELTNRLWSAQVSVFLPYVEEERRQILRELQQNLIVPFESENGTIVHTINALEIGHIYHQIFTLGVTADQQVRRHVRSLREIRNCLAHLGTLSPEIVKNLNDMKWQNRGSIIASR